MTPRFEDALDVSPLDDGANWRVLEAFHYDTDEFLSGQTATMPPVTSLGDGARIEIPKGFVTDFASIPKVLWGVVGGPADGKYRKAAVVHDFLYRTPGLATRKQADAVLYEAMNASGCSWHQRWVIFLGVRLGGHFSYKGCL